MVSNNYELRLKRLMAQEGVSSSDYGECITILSATFLRGGIDPDRLSDEHIKATIRTYGKRILS